MKTRICILSILLLAGICFAGLSREAIFYEGRDCRVTPLVDEEIDFLLKEGLKDIDDKLKAIEKDPNAEIQRILTYLNKEIAIEGRHEKIIKVQTDLIKKIQNDPLWWIDDRVAKLKSYKVLIDKHLLKVEEDINAKTIIDIR